MNGPTPPTLTVVPWRDEIVEAHGHRPGDPYIELCWLGIIGPSATWCWTHLARQVADGSQIAVDAADLAVTLGLGPGLAAHAPMTRTLARMDGFGVAQVTGNVVSVRLALPDLPRRRLPRLSTTARAAHDRLALMGVAS